LCKAIEFGKKGAKFLSVIILTVDGIFPFPKQKNAGGGECAGFQFVINK